MLNENFKLKVNENKDIRWIQRLANFQKAFAQLTKFIAKGQLSELEEQGLIKAFEYTFELAWTTMKDLRTNRYLRIKRRHTESVSTELDR